MRSMPCRNALIFVLLLPAWLPAILPCARLRAAEAPESPFVFTETDADEARVVLHADAVSDYVVSKELFGKFTEVLGSNTYHGFWAQVLENPSLEPVSGCLKDSAGDPAMDLPFAWHRWNGADTDYALVEGAFNTRYAQRLRVRALPQGTEAAGILQPVHLPLHRERRYELSVYVKDATAPVVASICVADRPDRIVGTAELGGTGSGEWRKLSASIRIELPADVPASPPPPLWVCLGLREPGEALLDQVLLWPADHVEGFDPDVVAKLRDYTVNVLRFPGGNYVSGYRWKDALTPPELRPTKPNPAWNDCDPNHVGTDEHIRLCRLIGAEPMICVNAGNGTPEEAADWVEYCNGDAATRWGRVRAERGHPEPFNVRIWEIGNELWGGWQIGHCTPEEYARRYRAFRDAMLKVDPDLRIIACGFQDWSGPGWNQTLFDECGPTVTSTSLHFLFPNSHAASPLSSHLCQMGYSHHFEAFVRNLDARARARNVNTRFAVTELMQIGVGRPYQVHPATLSEALFFAGTLNSCIRTEGMVEMITYSALVNHGGGLHKRNAVVYETPSFHVRRALSALAGGRPVGFELSGPFEDVPEWQPEWAGPTPRRFPLVDVMPVLRDNRLLLAILNRDPDRTIPVEIDPGGLARGPSMTVLEVSGASYMAQNSFRDPNRVAPVVRQVRTPEGAAPLRFAAKPASFLLVDLPRAEPGRGPFGNGPA